MTTKSLKIHTENLLPIIKQWLYSDREIFVRELISNACDAIQKCKVLREHNELQVSDDAFKIELQIDKAAKTLTFSDTGIGMSADEVEKYIAQIAFSGAEEFLGKYQSHQEKDQIIGHFGLGFYSAYMVAERVSLQTRSYLENVEPAYWVCDGSSSYTLDKGSRTERGTAITLHIEKNSEEFLEEARLREILQKHCAFLPIPIYLNGQKINAEPPLWLKAPSECTDEEYIRFYHTLYPYEPDPIFWIHLSVDFPFHLKGILYFPKITRRFDWNQKHLKLFCNRVFVSDNCGDLLPDYLAILRGAIDSPDIPLNVSRSTLQMDKNVRQLSQHISRKVSDRLASLHTSEREKFLKAWPDIEMIIKLGIMQDEKFYERSKAFLLWKTTEGNWTTAEEYLGRNRDKTNGRLFYTQDAESQSTFLSLYQQKGVEVLAASSPVDSPLMSFLERNSKELQFQRVDGAIDPTLLDPAREKTLLDADGKTEAVRMAEFARAQLSDLPVSVEAKSLSHDAVPAFVMLDEQMRRMRDTFSLTQQALPSGMASKRTFVLNTNSRVVQSLYRMREKQPQLAKEMLHHLYELSLLQQKELDPQDLPQFLNRANHILEQVAGLSLQE